MQSMPRSIQDIHLTNGQERVLLEYLDLDSAEDRLTWLYDRTPILPHLTESERLPALAIPGCLSGLWIQGEVHGDTRACTFRAASESKIVHGIATFLCDLYSHRSPEDLLAIDCTFTSLLRLEALLSVTRKRAVSAITGYIHGFARLQAVNSAAA